MKSITIPPVGNPASLITAKLHVWLNQFFLQLRKLVAALLFLIVAYFLARLISSAVRRVAVRDHHVDLGEILGSLAFGALVLLSLMIAAAIVFPSVKPKDILATLGIGSVAIGFAFKDILQNLFAGILLLINRPFRRGDQIVMKEYEGTVEHIQSRATLIRTDDGRRVIIPNADIYTSPVTVNTAFAQRRDELEIGIGYDDNPAAAARLILAAIRKTPGVAAEPAAEVIPWQVGDSDIRLKARWWTATKDRISVKSRVVMAVFEACQSNGIELPFPAQIVLLRQDEANPAKAAVTDGRQRLAGRSG